MTSAEELIAAAERLDQLVVKMDPLIRTALARALRNDAKRIIDSTLVQPFHKGNPDLLVIARLINGGVA